jgi:uncharacterized protein YbjT (DUF2867 family)
MMSDQKIVLVTGATGYVGSRMIPSLLERGYRVRCLVRDPAKLSHRSWLPQIEIVKADLIEYESVEKALTGVTYAYYLIHNMATGDQYSERDITSALNFASAASSTGVEHIIYLGGLADASAKMGSHLRSRMETGDTLRQGDVPVTEFRASIIIGSGSTAFEMIRFLTEQFPILAGPRWLHNRTQPIAIHNILDYLLAALETPTCRSQIYEIGGKAVITYTETMLIYARQRGLKRFLLTNPLIPIKLLSYIAENFTPVRAIYSYPLIDSMRSDSVINDNSAQQTFPHIKPLGYDEIITDILSKESPAHIEPVWGGNGNLDIFIKHEGFLIDCRKVKLDVSSDTAFLTFTRLGGKNGWLYLNWLWQLRGWLDRLIGGPGMRGRRNEDKLVVGDIIDFYYVEALESGRLMRLRSELKTPGTGWMEWYASPLAGGGTELTQVAYFAPRGLSGFLYWYLLYPLHRLVFIGLRSKIARQAGKLKSLE